MKNLMRMGKEDFLEGCFGEYPFFRWPNRCDRCPHRKECIEYTRRRQAEKWQKIRSQASRK